MLPRLCLAIFLSCLSAQLWAFTPVTVDSEDFRQSLGNWTYFLRDPAAELNATEVLGLPEKTFEQVDGKHANKGKNNDVWWFRVDLDSQLNTPSGALSRSTIRCSIISSCICVTPTAASADNSPAIAIRSVNVRSR